MPGERLSDDPMPETADAKVDPKAVVGRAFSAAASTYDTVIDFFGPFGRALVAAAEVAAGERVLDIGCGRGAVLRPAAHAVGPDGEVVGIDLAQGMVEQLRRYLQLAGVEHATVRHGDAEAIGEPDGSFDVALGGFMIFFAPDPTIVLGELYRVLRPGGRVALSIFDGPPGFPWQGEVFRELLGEQPSRSGDEFNRADVLDPALVAIGFEQPVGTDVVETVRFDSPDHVEHWQRSHGGRIVIDRLDDLQLERYRGLMAERLEGHRTDDGGIELVQRARMTVACKPA